MEHSLYSKVGDIFENGRYEEIIKLLREGLPKSYIPIGTKIEEYIIYGTNSCEFLDVKIKDGKVQDDYFRRLSVFDHNLGIKIDPSIFREIVEAAISKGWAFDGDSVRVRPNKTGVSIRTSIKLFILPPGKDCRYNMGWHYDYYGGETIALELFNDIDHRGTGRLALARNIHQGRKRPDRPGNTEDVVVDNDSTLEVEYPKNGMIIFDGLKGGIVHRPVDPTPSFDPQKGPSYRVLLQIVVRDDW